MRRGGKDLYTDKAIDSGIVGRLWQDLQHRPELLCRWELYGRVSLMNKCG